MTAPGAALWSLGLRRLDPFHVQLERASGQPARLKAKCTRASERELAISINDRLVDPLLVGDAVSGTLTYHDLTAPFSGVVSDVGSRQATVALRDLDDLVARQARLVLFAAAAGRQSSVLDSDDLRKQVLTHLPNTLRLFGPGELRLTVCDGPPVWWMMSFMGRTVAWAHAGDVRTGVVHGEVASAPPSGRPSLRVSTDPEPDPFKLELARQIASRAAGVHEEVAVWLAVVTDPRVLENGDAP